MIDKSSNTATGAFAHLSLSRVVGQNQTFWVTGKGGVGKTTIATALAEEVAKDHAVVLIEFGDGESAGRMLESKKVIHRIVEPDDAMVRAMSALVGSTWLAKLFTNNFAVRPMLRSAPALRELAMLEVVRQVCDEHPQAKVFVDLPATGHAIAWLKLPRQLKALFQSGALHDLADRVLKRVLDPTKTSVLVVSTAEPFVITETLDLARALGREVGLVPSGIIVNRFPDALPGHRQGGASSSGWSELDPGHLVSLVAALSFRDEVRSSALEKLGTASLPALLIPAWPTEHLKRDLHQYLAEALKDKT